jgi:putative hydrolase of HD superfamily
VGFAEHSFRTAVIASVLALMEGANPAQAYLLAVSHDAQETCVSDIPHIGRRYLDAASNESVTADQVSTAHPAVRAGVQRIVEEYENDDFLEWVSAQDADKLECLVQAVEYWEQGYQNVQPWIDSSINNCKSASAQALAMAALSMAG